MTSILFPKRKTPIMKRQLESIILQRITRLQQPDTESLFGMYSEGDTAIPKTRKKC